MFNQEDFDLLDERPDFIGYGEGISNEENWDV